MKQIFIILILILALSVVGCDDTTTPQTCSDSEQLIDGVCVPIEPTECEDDEQLIDDECVALPTELELAFEEASTLENYTLNIQITHGDVVVTMELQIEDNMSFARIANEETYYEFVDDVCYEYYYENDVLTTNEVPCVDTGNTSYDFFHGFEEDNFYLENDMYYLRSAHYSSVLSFFETSFSDPSLQQFTLTVSDDSIHTMDYTLVVDSELYEFHMELSNIGSTEVTIPVS